MLCFVVFVSVQFGMWPSRTQPEQWRSRITYAILLLLTVWSGAHPTKTPTSVAGLRVRHLPSNLRLSSLSQSALASALALALALPPFARAVALALALADPPQLLASASASALALPPSVLAEALALALADPPRLLADALALASAREPVANRPAHNQTNMPLHHGRC